MAGIFQARVGGSGGEFAGQFLDEGHQEVGIEDVGGFGQGAERGAADAEFFLDLAETASLTEAAEGPGQRAEEGRQDEGAVLVEVQLAVAGRVAGATGILQACQQRSEPAKVLPALQVGFLQRVSGSGIHASSMGSAVQMRKSKIVKIVILFHCQN